MLINGVKKQYIIIQHSIDTLSLRFNLKQWLVAFSYYFVIKRKILLSAGCR